MGETGGEYGEIIEARLFTHFPCQSTLKVLDIILLENVNLIYSQGGLILSTIKQFTRMSLCQNTNQFGKVPTRKIQGTFVISENDINNFDRLKKSCKFAGCKAPQPASTQGSMGVCVTCKIFGRWDTIRLLITSINSKEGILPVALSEDLLPAPCRVSFSCEK